MGEIPFKVKKDLVDQLVLEKIKEAKNSIYVSGFRKGKVPISLIKGKYEPSIKQEIFSKILDENIKHIISKEKLKPISTPKINNKLVDLDYIFQIYIETFPDVKIKNMVFNLNEPTVDITKKDLEDIVSNIREELGKWEKVERKSVKKDKIEISISISQDVKKRDFNKDKEISLIVENINKILYNGKQFEINLVGYKQGDMKALKLNDLLTKEEYEIHISIKQVFEKKILESDEELAKIVKSKSADFKDIESTIKENTYNQIKEISKAFLKNECIRELYEQNKFEIPNSLLKYKNEGEHDKKQVEDIGKKLVIELLIKEIIKKENIKIKK